MCSWTHHELSVCLVGLPGADREQHGAWVGVWTAVGTWPPGAGCEGVQWGQQVGAALPTRPLTPLAWGSVCRSAHTESGDPGVLGWQEALPHQARLRNGNPFTEHPHLQSQGSDCSCPTRPFPPWQILIPPTRPLGPVQTRTLRTQRARVPLSVVCGSVEEWCGRQPCSTPGLGRDTQGCCGNEGRGSALPPDRKLAQPPPALLVLAPAAAPARGPTVLHLNCKAPSKRRTPTPTQASCLLPGWHHPS